MRRRKDVDFNRKMHVVSSKMLNVKLIGKPAGKPLKTDRLQTRKALMMRGLPKSNITSVYEMQ